MNDLHLSQNAFATSISISATRLNNITKERNNPDSEILINILLKYRNVNPDWLLLGEGDMYRGYDTIIREPQASYGSCSNCTEKDRLIKILEQNVQEITIDKNYYRELLQDFRNHKK